MRSGVELWLENEFIENLKKVLLNSKESKFIEIGENIINSSDIVGIFSPNVMEEKSYIKRGYWKCDKNQWHSRMEKCSCPITNENGDIFIKGQGWVKNIYPNNPQF